MEILMWRRKHGSKFRQASDYLNCRLSEMKSHLVLPSKFNRDAWDYECLLCDNFVAASYERWDRHRVKHDRYVCNICNAKFYWRAEANKCDHLERIVDESAEKAYYGTNSPDSDEDDIGVDVDIDDSNDYSGESDDDDDQIDGEGEEVVDNERENGDENENNDDNSDDDDDEQAEVQDEEGSEHDDDDEENEFEARWPVEQVDAERNTEHLTSTTAQIRYRMKRHEGGHLFRSILSRYKLKNLNCMTLNAMSNKY
ncbi:uncharacterized protein LOC128390500 [Panonychus citri]|uniref:uncharacterized protein LOC128390500 n=1 Tax=Panonychus citri TaxID=50023 RepID=UPI0023082566|nr:uncharacterized protein LOC128390500 [Panonychus citri]